MSDNVVSIRANLTREVLSGVDEAIEHLKAHRETIKSMVIVIGDGDGFITWLGPDAESVSYATDFAKAVVASAIQQEYGL